MIVDDAGRAALQQLVEKWRQFGYSASDRGSAITALAICKDLAAMLAAVPRAPESVAMGGDRGSELADDFCATCGAPAEDELWAAFEAGHFAWPTAEAPTRRKQFEHWLTARPSAPRAIPADPQQASPTQIVSPIVSNPTEE